MYPDKTHDDRSFFTREINNILPVKNVTGLASLPGLLKIQVNHEIITPM